MIMVSFVGDRVARAGELHAVEDSYPSACLGC